MRDHSSAARRISPSDHWLSGLVNETLAPTTRTGHAGSLNFRRLSSAIKGDDSQSSLARFACRRA